MPVKDEMPTTVGFLIPALVYASPSSSVEAMAGMLEAATRSPHICGLATVTKLDEEALKRLQPLLDESTLLAAASADAEGEVVVL